LAAALQYQAARHLPFDWFGEFVAVVIDDRLLPGLIVAFGPVGRSRGEGSHGIDRGVSAAISDRRIRQIPKALQWR
jgi:hypothetical protein